MADGDGENCSSNCREEEAFPDIEDLIPSSEEPRESSRAARGVLPRALRRNNGSNLVAEGDSFIPGSQSIYIKTWGCSHNTSDGEYMAGLLAAEGYTITDSPLDAHVWLLNSCTVKGPSEDGFKSAIKKGKELNKTLIVAGCVPQGQKDLDEIKDISAVGVKQIDRIVEVVEGALKGGTIRLFGTKRGSGRQLAGPSLELPKIRKNPLVEIIPINSGCLNHCTYCKTKHSRGNLASYYPQEIISRATQAFEEGVVEIWLTSEDTGAYGRDIGVTLPELLWQLVEVMPEGSMLRIGMTNPPYIMEHLEEMAKILSHPRVYSFLHVPVQSGSDAVLGEMKREYTIKQFQKVVDYLKEQVPGVTIATDVICGFPTETEEDFSETLSLVNEYKFPSLFINQFYPRPGTPAAKMKRIPTNEVKNRSRKLTELFHSYTPYSERVGGIETILVTEMSHDKRYYVGHTKYYEQVLVPQYQELMGKMALVKIVSTGKHFMMAEIIDVLRLPTDSVMSGGDKYVGKISASNKMLGLILIVMIVLVLYRLPHIIAVFHKLYI